MNSSLIGLRDNASCEVSARVARKTRLRRKSVCGKRVAKFTSFVSPGRCVHFAMTVCKLLTQIIQFAFGAHTP